MCFALHRDTAIKRGQIAHIDGDPSNNDFENLAFLCLAHHEEYDSTSRQAKGITEKELRTYRQELYDSIASEWSKPAPFTIPSLDPIGTRAGHYVLQQSSSSAEFQFSYLGNGIMQVSGFATWQGASSAHTGAVDFVADVRDNHLFYADRVGDQWYNLALNLGDGSITAVESTNSSYHGMNVSFAGHYRRV